MVCIKGAVDAGRSQGRKTNPHPDEPHGQRHALLLGQPGAAGRKAGASFISPFVGRIDDTGSDGMELIQEIPADLRQLTIPDQTHRLGAHGQPCQAGGPHRRRCHHRAASNAEALVNHPLTDKGLATSSPTGPNRPENRLSSTASKKKAGQPAFLLRFGRSHIPKGLPINPRPRRQARPIGGRGP